MTTITLPFPPSVNNLFAGKGRRYPSKHYSAWQAQAGLFLNAQRPPKVPGQVRVSIELCPPDKRRRDLDNLAKAPLDLLVKHGVIEDDSAVCALALEWVNGGECRVTITPAGAA